MFLKAFLDTFYGIKIQLKSIATCNFIMNWSSYNKCNLRIMALLCILHKSIATNAIGLNSTVRISIVYNGIVRVHSCTNHKSTNAEFVRSYIWLWISYYA